MTRPGCPQIVFHSRLPVRRPRPFPADLQGYVVMEAGVAAAAKDQAAAVALVKFLKSPEHVPVIKQKGMEPG